MACNKNDRLATRAVTLIAHHHPQANSTASAEGNDRAGPPPIKQGGSETRPYGYHNPFQGRHKGLPLQTNQAGEHKVRPYDID